MMESFMENDIENAKKKLVDYVNKIKDNEKVKNDKELAKWIKGRQMPDKKEKQIDDILNIFARLDGYALMPEILVM